MPAIRKGPLAITKVTGNSDLCNSKPRDCWVARRFQHCDRRRLDVRAL